jgi:hypothetical protein
MGNLVESIARICAELSSGGLLAAARIADQELSTPADSRHRRYTAKEQTRLFLREGFIDRFSGDRLGTGVAPAHFTFSSDATRWCAEHTLPALAAAVP